MAKSGVDLLKDFLNKEPEKTSSNSQTKTFSQNSKSSNSGTNELRSFLGMEPKQIDPQNLKQNYKSFRAMSPVEQMKVISSQRTEKTIPITERINKEKQDQQAEREARRYVRPTPQLPTDQFEIDQNIPISEHTTFDTKGQIQNKKYNLQVDALRKHLEAVQELPDFYQVTEQGKNRANQMAKESGLGTRYYEEAAKYAASPEYGDFLAISNTIPELSTKRLSKMTDTEKNVLLYYIGTGDTRSAKKYYEDVLERELNKRHQTAFNQGVEELANKHKIIGALGNIVTSPGQVAGVFETFRQNIENLITGQDKPVDAYSPAMSAAHFGNSTAQGITRDMNAFERLLVQTGLSLGQMAMTLPFGETGSLLLMSSEAAGNAVLDATQRGASAPQALASGLLAGAIEFATEKLPIDNLFRIAKSGKSVSRNMVKEVLKQAGVEGTEELVSEYANALTDIALMGNKSSYHLRIQELMQSGMSRKEAEKQAILETFIIQPMMSFAGGSISGVAMGGAAAGFNFVSDYQQNRTQNQPYLYQPEPEAFAPKSTSVLERKINQMEMKSMESILAELDQNPTQALQNPQNAETILQPENVEAVYEYANEKYGEKGFEAAKSIIEAANNTMEQSAKDNAVEGENNITPGLVNNEQAKRFNIKSRNILNKIAKMLGVQIEFSDAEDIGNGYYENGKIVLSTKSENPIRDILRHELTHHFQKMAPQEYEAYCSYVLDVMKKADPEYLDSEMALTKSLYEAKTGNEYKNPDVIDEIVSDFTMNFTDNPEEFFQFAKENRNIAQKIVDSLHEIIVKIRSAMEKAFGSVKRDLGESERYNPYGLALEQFEQAEALWREALRVSIEAKNDAISYTNRKYNVAQEGNKSVNSHGIIGVVKKGSASYGASKKDPSIKSAEPLFNNTIAQKNGGVNPNIRENGENDTRKYSLNANFSEEFDQWLQSGKQKTPASGRFFVGTTSDALKSIGVDDYKIYWNKGKIAKIMKEHPEMMANVIKKVPDILEHPILVMQSQTVANRITLFGETMDVGGNPVLAAIELRPQNKSGEVMDFAVIASAYGKTGAQNIIDTSDILYVDPNQKRTDTWLKLLRLQLPSRITKYGSIANVTYVNRDVKGVISFGSDEPNSAMADAFAKALDQAEQNNPSNPSISKNGENDTDFSISTLERENARLKEQLNYWKGQTKRSKGISFEEKTTLKIAKDILSEYDSGADAAEIAGKIKTLYEYIANGEGKEKGVSWVEVKKQANEIATEIVENAEVLDDSLYHQYSDLRKQLRGNTYYFDPQSRADLEANGGYEAIRKHNMGRFFLSGDSSKTGINTLYEQLTAEYGSSLFPEEITHPADQLIQISKVLDDIQPVMENPYSADVQQVIEHVGNQIFDQFFETPQMKPTFADRQAKKLKENKAAWNKKHKEAMRKLRADREQKLAELRKKYQASNAKAREKREAGDLRAKIRRHASGLSQKLLKPTDKQNIPESMRQAVADMLRSINLESSFVVDPATGKRVKLGTKQAEGIESPEATKRTEAFRNIREQYEKIAKEEIKSDLVFDAELTDRLGEIEKMADKRLSDMGIEELQLIWDTVKEVEASISTAGKTFNAEWGKSIAELADPVFEEVTGRKPRKNFRDEGKGIAPAIGSGLNRIDGLLNIDMLSPETYFHRFGKTGDKVFRMMRKAEDQQTRILAEATAYTQRMLQEVLGEKKARALGKAVREMENEMHTFQTSGGTLELSTAQIMELYNLSKRKQSNDHIYIGGVSSDGSAGKGVFQNTTPDAVHVTQEDVQNIVSSLTDQQKALADKMMEFLSGTMAEYGNQASMDVYQIKKFKEPNYWPIHVDKTKVKSEAGKGEIKSVPSYGMTKGINPDAKNAVMLGSAFSTYTQHISEMAVYSAWLKTWYDVERLRNFTYYDMETGQEITKMQNLVNVVYGKYGNNYWLKLMEDIAKGTKNKADTVFSMEGAIGNTKAAAIAANLRVVFQQPTSYFRAGAVMDWKYLAKATFTGRGWEKAKKYAPIAQWKDWGYFDINTGRNLRDIMLNTESILENGKQKTMALAGMADSFTWGRLWNACELETADKRTDLTRGSEAFYQAVAERFAEIIDRTQVVDSVMQRTQYMRSSNGINRMAASFMSEPSKIYNMVLRDCYDLKNAKNPQVRKKAAKSLARTSVSLVLSFVANAAVQSFVDAFRDDDREKKYWEKFLESLTGMSGEEEKFWDYWSGIWSGNLGSAFNPLTYIPVVRDVMSVAQGYDVSRMDMDSITKFIRSADSAMKSFQGSGKYKPTMAVINLITEASRLLGLPVSNVKRFVSSVLGTALNESDSYVLQYYVDKALLNPNASVNSDAIMDNLYKAKKNNPEAYQIIYDDMVESGISKERIKDNMDSRRKKEAEYQQKQKKALEDLNSAVQGSQAYQSLSEKEIESTERLIKSYSNYIAAPEEAPEDDQKCWKKQKDSGVPLSQYVIYKSFDETKQEDVINRIQKTFHFSESKAEEMYYKIESYLYPGDDLDEAQEKKVNLCKKYGFTESEYMKAYNALRGVMGTKNRAGKTISGSEKRNKMKALHEAGFTGVRATKMYQILEGEIKE